MPRVTITVPEKSAQPYRFQLDREVVTLGRGSENDIAIESGSVSVNHAEMRRIKGGYELRDVGSTNGIKMEGVRHDTIALRSGMSVKIGDVAFDFALTDEELDILSGESSGGLPALKGDSDDAVSKPVPHRESYAPARSSGGGFGAGLMFLILAAFAFFAGLAIRFQKETGGSFLDALKNRSSVVAPAAKGTGEGPAE